MKLPLDHLVPFQIGPRSLLKLTRTLCRALKRAQRQAGPALGKKTKPWLNRRGNQDLGTGAGTLGRWPTLGQQSSQGSCVSLTREGGAKVLVGQERTIGDENLSRVLSIITVLPS